MGENNSNIELNANGKIELTQEEYEKAIQSAEDKIRTKYYSEDKPILDKQISELLAQVKDLEQYKPVQKSDAELALEEREAEVARKEKLYARQDELSQKGIDKAYWDFLKDDADADSFNKTLNDYFTKRFNAEIGEKGYIPKNPIGGGSTITKEDFRKMSILEKQTLYETEPELYKTLNT